MYSESGWDYVTRYGLFNVFASPDYVNAPELHTDPAEQAYTLNYLDKKLRISAIGVAVSVIFMIGIIAAMWFIDSEHYLAIVEGFIIQQTISVIVILYLAYTSLQATVSIHSIRKTLSEGKPINHSAPWKMRHKVNLINSRYSYAWSIFSPLQIKSDESGEVANELWKDGSGKYSPNISTWAYKINLPHMNEGVLSDLINRYGEKFKGAVYVEMEHPDFDKLIVHEGDYYEKEVFAAKGKGVIYIRYQGNAPINSIIEAIAEKIKLISD